MKRNKTIKNLAALLIMLALMIDCFSVNAAKSKKKSVINDSPKEKTDKRYDDLFKGKKLKRETGLISIILCEKEVYMEIPRSLLGEELIMGTSVVSSSAPREITEGIKPKPYKSVMFSKAGDMLNLGIVNKKYFNSSEITTDIYPKESRSAIIASFKIAAENSKDSSFVIKATSLFKGDKDYLTPKDENAYNNMRGFVVRTYKYNDKAELINDIATDSHSFSVTSELSYHVTRRLFTMSVIGRDEPVTAKVRTSFVLPKTKKDSHTTFCVPKGVGVTKIPIVDFSNSYQGVKVKYLAGRWQMKEDKALIDFEIDEKFPQLWKTAIRKSADIWNNAFQEAGINVTAISISEQDSTSSLLSNKIHYVMTPSENINGNIWYDPLTAEIFNADISISHNIIKEIQRDAFLSLSPYLPQARELIPDSTLFVDMLAQKIAFQMGLCLGFSENTKASSQIPSDSLSSASFTSNHGIVTSLMDQAGFNYAATEEGIRKGAKLCQHKAGVQDIYSIKYLYGDYEGENPYPSCKYILNSPKLDSGYIFGRKSLMNESVDPSSLLMDLGDNQIKSSSLGLETLEKVIHGASGWLDNQDCDYEYRASLYDHIVDRYFKYISNVTASIGGRNKDELNGVCNIVEHKLQIEALLWTLARIKETDRYEDARLMSESELNVGIADYMTEETFRSLMLKVLSMDEYRIEMLKEIDSFVWNGYPSARNITNKEFRSIRIQSMYIEMLMKELGLDKDKIEKIWQKDDAYKVFSLLKDSKKRLNGYVSSGTQLQRDNAVFLLKRLNDKL